MPFKSKAQRRFMYAKHPKIAKRWERHTPEGDLPEKVSSESFENKIERLLGQPIDISISNNGLTNAVKKMRGVIRDLIESEYRVSIDEVEIPINKAIKMGKYNDNHIGLDNIKSTNYNLVEDPGYSIGWAYGDADGNLRRYLDKKLNRLHKNKGYVVNSESYDKYIIESIVEYLHKLESSGKVVGLHDWVIKPSLTHDQIIIRPR